MGLDEFLDSVTVLPPGEWDRNIRIEPPTSVPSQVQFISLFRTVYVLLYIVFWLIIETWAVF